MVARTKPIWGLAGVVIWVVLEAPLLKPFPAKTYLKMDFVLFVKMLKEITLFTGSEAT